MISSRMNAEEKLIIQEMIADLNEIWHMIDEDKGPHRGGITGAGMQTDFLRSGKAGDLWDAHVIIRKAKVKQQMVAQSHAHDEDHWHESERRWGQADRAGRSGDQQALPVIDEWPRRYK